MSIFPLPVFEADAEAHHRSAMTEDERAAQLAPPESVVVKFGFMKLVGEFPYNGDGKPGCGTRLVARTHRGTELVEMLTTTCDNPHCDQAVSRNEMLDFIDRSGGRDFPFFTNGRILRVATVEDLNRQSALESDNKHYIRTCKRLVDELGLRMKLVDVEPILGGELLTFYYMAEERVDFRELVKRLAGEFKTRIEMRQVGARDEARLVADYERCGQYCCCKSFLKVLKPVSMKAAKLQKATLDPLKISGRCGRLMCCLRYEDDTYRELQKRLPRKNSRVGTAEGPGVVVDGKVLVQLALVRLEHDNREIAVPVEELMDPDHCPPPSDTPAGHEITTADPLRGMPEERVLEKSATDQTPPDRRRTRGGRGRKRRRRKPQTGDAQTTTTPKTPPESAAETAEPTKRRRSSRRRRRRRSNKPGDQRDAGNDGQTPPAHPH